MSERRNRAAQSVLWLLVLVGFCAALRAGYNRANTEADNRRVEIALDYNELRNLAAAEGKPLSTVLSAFKTAAGPRGGITSVAVGEETIASLEEAQTLKEISKGSRGTTYLYGLPDAIARVREALSIKTRYPLAPIPAGDPLPFGVPPALKSGLRIDEPNGLVRGVGLGLSPESVAAVRKAGLRIVGRVNNWEGVDPKGIVWILQGLKRDGASTIIFSGDEVLGYKGYVTDKDPGVASTESAIREAGLQYGTVEFGKQKGDDTLSGVLEERLVRVHTVTGAEMQTATIPGNIQRFLLAARERNIRCLYIRLFLNEPQALDENVQYVKSIVDDLVSHGMTPGLAHGYPPLKTSWHLRGLIGLGLAAGWLLLLDAVTGLFRGGRPGASVGAVGIAAAALLFALPLLPDHLPLVPHLFGVKIAALAAAILFPTLALLRKNALRPAGGDQSPLLVALLRFVTACAVTAVGISYIVGLLANRLFLLKIDVFVGIKPAKIIPVLLVALIYWLALRADHRRTWKQALIGARDKIVALSREPILLWQIIVAIAAMVILALVVMRAGNDPGIGVSGTELKIRALLDRLLPARPRFQEFLIGHPALILSFVLAARGQRAWAFPLFIIGAIGQVSLLNTFCHLHTPLAASLWRAGIGIGIGIAVALVLYLPLRHLLRRLPPAPLSADD